MSVDAPRTLLDDRPDDGPDGQLADQHRTVVHPSRRPLVAGLAAGIWALLVGIAAVTCVVMVAWAVAPHSAGDAAAAWRAAGLTWLGSHQVPMTISGSRLSLLPSGAILLGVLLARRGGRWAGRLLPQTTLPEALGIVVAGSLAYGTGGAGVAWLSGGSSAAAEPAHALLGTAVVAGIGLGWGVAREAGLTAFLRSRVSDAAWRTTVAGVAASVGLFAVGAVLVAASLARHVAQVGTTLADLDAGLVGGLLVTLIGALAVPTLAVWGLSVAVGPGFDVGTTGTLSAFGGAVDSLPALPVLAAIPAQAPSWAGGLLLAPVALGWAAGRMRWGRDLPTLEGALVAAAGVAGVVLTLVAGMAAFASGSLGGGALDRVGPSPLTVGIAAAVLVALGFLVEAGTQSTLLSWRLYRAAQRSRPRPADPQPVALDPRLAQAAERLHAVTARTAVLTTAARQTAARARERATTAASVASLPTLPTLRLPAWASPAGDERVTLPIPAVAHAEPEHITDVLPRPTPEQLAAGPGEAATDEQATDEHAPDERRPA